MSREELSAYFSSLFDSSSDYNNRFYSFLSYIKSPVFDKNFRVSLLDDCTKENIDWYSKEASEFLALFDFMFYTRRFFFPVTMVGQQHEDYEVLYKLDKFLASRSKKQKQRWDD